MQHPAVSGFTVVIGNNSFDATYLTVADGTTAENLVLTLANTVDPIARDQKVFVIYDGKIWMAMTNQVTGFTKFIDISGSSYAASSALSVASTSLSSSGKIITFAFGADLGAETPSVNGFTHKKSAMKIMLVPPS